MPLCFRGLIFSLAAAVWLAPAPAGAVMIRLDYSYDTGFFGAGTQARSALEAATGFYSNILNDTLAAIQFPAPKFTGTSGHMVTWNWSLNVSHPRGLGSVTFSQGTVPADEIVIYPGAKVHAGNTLAIGSPGGANVFRSGSGLSNFTSVEIAQINTMEDEFVSTVTRRGQPSGFAAWGGSISFDLDTQWHFNHATAPAAGKIDLYSVAIHELAHTLGFGVSPEWTSLAPQSGTKFNGAASTALYGGSVPLTASNSHWAEGLGSNVFGGSVSQAAAMTPSISAGMRKKLTSLDAAALADLGWSVILPPGPTGDYNGDGIVNAADYTVWRNTFGQSANLAADGNNSNSIDMGDYTVWKSNYGEGNGNGAGSGAESPPSANGHVPEPGSLMLCLVGVAIASVCKSRIGQRHRNAAGVSFSY